MLGACGRIGYGPGSELQDLQAVGGLDSATQEALREANANDVAGAAPGSAGTADSVEVLFDVQQDDFLDVSAWTLNGARVVDGRLNPHPGGFIEPGSAFLNETISLSDTVRISAHFAMDLADRDGLTLILHNDANGTAALGGKGGGQGYARDTIIAPSLALEIDGFQNSYDTDDNHIALAINGAAEAPASSFTPEFVLRDAGVFHLWLDYDGRADRVEVRLALDEIRPADPILTLSSFDLANLLGDLCYVGFTGASSAHLISFLRLTATDDI